MVQHNIEKTSETNGLQAGIDDTPWEKEADVMGAKALQMKLKKVNRPDNISKTVQRAPTKKQEKDIKKTRALAQKLIPNYSPIRVSKANKSEKILSKTTEKAIKEYFHSKPETGELHNLSLEEYEQLRIDRSYPIWHTLVKFQNLCCQTTIGGSHWKNCRTF